MVAICERRPTSPDSQALHIGGDDRLENICPRGSGKFVSKVNLGERREFTSG
jgi:hypothetical protein